jgi:hypothetical protein|tara:strand:+ start:110 stop:274 length:165 start_codon:yes stop_codon:yes gene_type:complete
MTLELIAMLGGGVSGFVMKMIAAQGTIAAGNGFTGDIAGGTLIIVTNGIITTTS